MTIGLLDAARSWAEADPDPQTRADLLALLTAAGSGDPSATAELEDAFEDDLPFRTTGLLGQLGAGPNRMNAVVVARAAAGLAAYLNERGGGSVAIGYDARRNSGLFARVTAQILSGAGLTPIVLPAHVPTPVLAFAVRHLGCAAGVMVTADGAPADHNGYRVHLGDGAPVPPYAASEIAVHIAAVASRGPVRELPHGDEWTTLDEAILDDYVTRTVSVLEDSPVHHLRIAYSPLHGVAARAVDGVFRAAAFPAPMTVAVQAEPDPAFPTVTVPSLDDPQALDLAIALATDEQADLVLATDPDGGRLAVAVPDADGWRVLNGDEVGSLLGWWVASGNRRLARRGVFAQSSASGAMLEDLARDFHIEYEETLGGFWALGRVPDLMFGYQDSRSYCVDPIGVHDRDGISAALMVAEMASRLQRMERTMLDMLDDLERTYGVHLSGSVAGPVRSTEDLAAALASLRDAPPASVGGLDVARVDDLTTPLGGLVGVQGVRVVMDGGTRVTVQADGSRLVAHVRCVVHCGAGGLDEARAASREQLRALRADVVRWLG